LIYNSDKTNVENEIISKEVDISSEMVKQDARKIHFQVKINGEDINKIDQRRRFRNKHGRAW